VRVEHVEHIVRTVERIVGHDVLRAPPLPDEKEHASRPVLPAHDGVGVELRVIEAVLRCGRQCLDEPGQRVEVAQVEHLARGVRIAPGPREPDVRRAKGADR
jgi:hypothetical protein